MRRLPIGPLAILIAVGVAVLGSSDATAAPPANCGPGAHWIDSCGGGIPPYPDAFPTSGAVVGIDVNGNCLADFSVIVNGPATVDRQDASDDSANFPGPPNPPVLDAHVDTIDTEIVSMSLTGGGITVRAGAGGVPALLPSKGLVVEQAANNTKADSFFDVFFEVTGVVGPAFNHQPLRVASVIDQVPPVGAAYMHPSGCLPLFTAPVGGALIAGLNLVEAKHLPGGFPVGGKFEAPDIAQGAAAAGVSSSSGSLSPAGIAAIAGGLAAAAVAVAAGGWYTRRRWLRREG